MLDCTSQFAVLYTLPVSVSCALPTKCDYLFLIPLAWITNITFLGVTFDYCMCLIWITWSTNVTVLSMLCFLVAVFVSVMCGRPFYVIGLIILFENDFISVRLHCQRQCCKCGQLPYCDLTTDMLFLFFSNKDLLKSTSLFSFVNLRKHISMDFCGIAKIKEVFKNLFLIWRFYPKRTSLLAPVNESICETCMTKN